jgi:hypothetical protein
LKFIINFYFTLVELVLWELIWKLRIYKITNFEIFLFKYKNLTILKFFLKLKIKLILYFSKIRCTDEL